MATVTSTAGAAAFAKFLADTGQSDGDAAKALDTNEISVYQWRTGRARPRDVFREKVARWTNGVVGIGLWLTDQERAESAMVQPYKPAAEG